MRQVRRLTGVLALICAAAGSTDAAIAQPLHLAGTTCETPPVLHCPDEKCAGSVVTNGGPALEPKTNRNFFLDYPCNLKRGEKVTFILSLHGGGSYANWQRHYFPILDYKDKHRLVIATPFSPRRVWAPEDDEYLQNIVSSVIGEIGRENIKAFWLVGHSQGGATSNRLICTDFFKTKVDGFLSLSGGRVGGQAGRSSNFENLAPRGGGPDGRGGAGLPGGARGSGTPAPPSCDFSFVYTTGEHEIVALPDSSAWAQKYGCRDRDKRRDVVDSKAGYVYDSTRQNPGSKGWGLLPRPGRAEVFVYPGCRDKRVVADVMRIDKGHTEGLEPKVTEELVKLMLSAGGGKIQRGG